MQPTLTTDQLFDHIQQLSPTEQFQLAQTILATLFQETHLTTETVTPSEKKQRKLNLHPGAMVMHEGFDDELPDDFWLGDDTDEVHTRYPHIHLDG